MYRKSIIFKSQSQIFPTYSIMNEAKFWQFIEEAKQKTPDVEAQCDWMIDNMVQLSVKDMIRYQQMFEKKMEDLSFAKLWLAAQYILDSETEEDMEERYPYFSAWIIAQGQEVFEKTKENPDNLAAFLSKNEEGEFVCECEMMLYIADNAYEMKTGEEDFYEKFEGEPFFEIIGDFPEDEVDFEEMFPMIAAKKNAV